MISKVGESTRKDQERYGEERLMGPAGWASVQESLIGGYLLCFSVVPEELLFPLRAHFSSPLSEILGMW